MLYAAQLPQGPAAAQSPEVAIFNPHAYLQFPNSSPFPSGVELVLGRWSNESGVDTVEYIPEGEDIENWSQYVGIGALKFEPDKVGDADNFLRLLIGMQNAALPAQCQVSVWNEFDNWIVESKFNQCAPQLLGSRSPNLSAEHWLTGVHQFIRYVPGQHHIYMILYIEKTAGMSVEKRQTVFDWLKGITPRK